MANAVAVIGLLFDDTDIQTPDFGIFLEIVRGLNEGPEIRGTDTTVPGRAGRIARNRIGDRLTIEVRGFISEGIGGTLADFATNRQIIRALFDPTKAPADLVAALEDGSTATISARGLPGQLWDQVAPTFANVSIELESVDPDWVIVPA